MVNDSTDRTTAQDILRHYFLIQNLNKGKSQWMAQGAIERDAMA
jgi:hypothetical protein